MLEEGGVKFIALRCAGFDKVGAAPAPLLAPSCCLLTGRAARPQWALRGCGTPTRSQTACLTRRVDQQPHPAPHSLRRWMWRRAPATASASCASPPTGVRPPSRSRLLAWRAPVS